MKENLYKEKALKFKKVLKKWKNLNFSIKSYLNLELILLKMELKGMQLEILSQKVSKYE